MKIGYPNESRIQDLTRADQRRGVISVAVLVCLLVATLICGSLLRLVVTQHGLLRTEERRLQADWLAESGLAHAVARLAADPAYRGETWLIGSEQLGAAEPAVVTITVVARPDGDVPDQRLVTSHADYPRELPRRVRSRKQLNLPSARHRSANDSP